jgi:hypothetical protein
MPPAYKGSAGINDVGYGVYDIWDLGEFDQRGGIPTKYGTREEYQEWKLNWPQTADDCGKFTPARQWRKSKTAK